MKKYKYLEFNVSNNNDIIKVKYVFEMSKVFEFSIYS